MKNIHLLPTIKPSRVYNILGSKIIGFTSNDPFYTENFGGGTQNLNVHITSNEKVKDGDWFINTFNDNQPKLQKRYGDWITCYNQHKIILTTDPELIKDGVQAIDDEFFRWFVNNPSCEFIKVEPCEFLADKVIYEIIIPQEETKQLTDLEIAIKLEEIEREEFQQETLEETTEINLTRLCYYDKRNPDFQIKEEYGYDKEEVEATGNFSKKDCACDNCFYGRSKLTEQLIWQQERMYSEEDLRNAYRWGTTVNHETKEHFNEWFEQVKKK